MLSNTISVSCDVSVLRMLRLGDTDNILINRIDIIRKYHDMLLSRLSTGDQHDVRIHVRPHLLIDDTERYLAHLKQGAQVVVWQGDSAHIHHSARQLTVVVTDQANTVRREGFLAIKTPTSNRVLAVWQDVNNEIVGVLVTNPVAAEEVVARLDAIIQSPAR